MRVTTNYDVSPRVELTINAQHKSYCYVVLVTHSGLACLESHHIGLFNVFFLLGLSQSSCESRAPAHVCTVHFAYCRVDLARSGLIVRLKYRILDIQCARATRFSARRDDVIERGNYEEHISINMCEHEQNFSCTWCRALFIFVYFFWKILSSSSLYIVVLSYFFLVIRCSCLEPSTRIFVVARFAI